MNPAFFSGKSREFGRAAGKNPVKRGREALVGRVDPGYVCLYERPRPAFDQL